MAPSKRRKEDRVDVRHGQGREGRDGGHRGQR